MANRYSGNPRPYGATIVNDGVNFALFARNATAVTLCLFDRKNVKLLEEIVLDPELNRTGDIWHIFLTPISENQLYGYKIEGPEDPQFCYTKKAYLLDPYALEIGTRNEWRSNSHLEEPQRKVYLPLGAISAPQPFDWQGIKPPRISMEKLVIYEMHVRGFTVNASSGVAHPGTFLSIVEKIPYLLDLGISAVELMPVFEFDENENRGLNPATRERLCNFWGYSSVSFFAPMNRYTTSDIPGSGINEFKTMVRELHRNNIEVILDVVYNHTAEGNEKGPVYSFKGIDNPVYYIVNEEGAYLDFCGCGNTMNANNPIVINFIIDSLRYWAMEMQVDGFRFDLASALTRGRLGKPLDPAPLIDAITEDPFLKNVKLIAEPWDAAGLYQVGQFYPQSPRWLEWNGKYRDCVRRFMKGAPGSKSEFITRICGSEDLYHNRSPLNSINFITAHDGFSLIDLVSYNQKANLENGEENRDGESNNESWNCGEEGPSKDKKVLDLRGRQVRNLHFVLMVSAGTPMILMGDEYLHTKNGNNNPWCQDSNVNWFLWNQLEENADFVRFHKGLIHFRNTHPLLQRKSFLREKDALWHGTEPFLPDWNPNSQFAAFTLLDHDGGNDLYIAINAHDHPAIVEFPDVPDNKQWLWIVNTGNPPPNDYFESEAAPPVQHNLFKMLPFSVLMLKLVEK